MRRKKNRKLIVLSLIVICMNTISLSKHKENVNFQMNTKITKPIVVLEKDEMIKSEIRENLFPIEYNFSINNYKEDEINEVDFDYRIEIEDSADNFPISYTLFDCNNEEEIEVIDGKSRPMKIKKSVKESRKFKLFINWRELDVDLADELQIKLKVKVQQSKAFEK